jgi:hypothetical protein
VPPLRSGPVVIGPERDTLTLDGLMDESMLSWFSTSWAEASVASMPVV